MPLTEEQINNKRKAIQSAINMLLMKDSYLQSRGWFQSFVSSMPVNQQGRAIPWLTYPAIEFLEKRVKKQMSVFEYGSGNSTIWWSGLVSTITSCEHDKSWYDKMNSNLPANVRYLHFVLIRGGDYSKVIGQYDKEFDIVVIDGRDRVNCAMNSLNALKKNGVILFDDSDRDLYQEGYDYLNSNGFKRLDFWGIGPITAYAKCTSIFYKQDNCLDL